MIAGLIWFFKMIAVWDEHAQPDIVITLKASACALHQEEAKSFERNNKSLPGVLVNIGQEAQNMCLLGFFIEAKKSKYRSLVINEKPLPTTVFSSAN